MAYLLQRLLTEAAARHPQRPAVASSGSLLTYQELDQLSNKVARALLRVGVAPGDRVGILAPKSVPAVAGIYGVLKAGACYVPLDPKAPDQRLSYVIQDSTANVIVTDETRTSQAVELVGTARGPRGVVVAPSDACSEGSGQVDIAVAGGAVIMRRAAVATERPEPLAEERAIETDLAYILYTSGSTGTPKGVMISHRNSLTFAEWAAAAAGLSEEDRVCSPAPLHFDLSVFDVFSSCRAAACLAVLPEGSATFPVSIAQWLEQERISVWYSVPSVLTLLACYGGLRQLDLSHLRTVIFAGEVFPPKHFARLMEELPHPRYLNWYGPTETNVCTSFEVPADWADAGPVPIGKACANTEVFAVTSEGLRVSEAGETGELYVRGPSLMRGYWGQPAKTREVLVQSPFRPEYDENVYRTGDLVSLDSAGNYIYVGRRDSMVKIRGYRVELGEVEAALYRHPAIREVAVLPVPDELLGSRLRAVVIADDEGQLVRQSVLDHCRQWLPSYMVPDVLEFREAMPRTSTGKVDRAGLASEQHAQLRQPQQNSISEHRRRAPTWRPLSMTTSAPNSSATRSFSRSQTRHHCWTAAFSIRSASCSWWSSWRSDSESLWATLICSPRTSPA
jgi:amino acid adenylation domain-containing protein